MTSKYSKKEDTIALRKQLIQMRLELNRQKVQHEALVLLEPVQKFRRYKKRFTQGSTPFLAIAGVTLASFLITRQRGTTSSSLMPLLRVAASLLPLFASASAHTANTDSTQADNLD